MYEIYINDRPLRLIATADLENYAAPRPSQLLARYSGKVKTLLNYADMLEKGSPKVTSLVLHYPSLQQLWEDFLSHYKIITAAGGVVQLQGTDKLLFIYRCGYLDLPKGKIDPGETPEQAAIREVQEETGLQAVAITPPAPDLGGPALRSETSEDVASDSELPIYPTNSLKDYPTPPAPDLGGPTLRSETSEDVASESPVPRTLYPIPRTTYHTYRNKKGKRILKPTYWYPMITSQEALVPQTEEDIEWARWMTVKEAVATGLQRYASLEKLLGNKLP